MYKKVSKKKKLYRKLKMGFRKIVRKIKKYFTYGRLEKESFRFASFVLILVMVSGVLNVPTTNAFYNDTETSNGNGWVSGALDFTISDGGFVPSELALNLEPSTTTSKTIGMSLEPGSNSIKYHASTTNFVGDAPFCEAIELKAVLNGQSQFSGKLKDFFSPATTTVSFWNYDFSMPANPDFYNKVCTFVFEYNGRQTVPHNEYNDGGYYDIENATSTIYSWGFRINKVYYDVAPDRGAESVNEWVEIYNQTDTSLDINNWEICDNGGCDKFASTSPIIIPAKGFAVVTASSTTWKYWELADDVVPIVLNSPIGNGLSNTGDRILLKRPDGLIIDVMAWGSDTDVWNPASPDVPEGHTLGRKPNGYDANQSSDFVDLSPPVLNLISPNQSGLLTWYWTYSYNILWTATNPNGLNNNLKIDLSYIKDIDASHTITSGDESVSIASGLDNTGSYSWDLPSGFLGYIWVKITAFGPENSMLNSFRISGKIWDPPLWVDSPGETLLIEVTGESEEVFGSMSPFLSEEGAAEENKVNTTVSTTTDSVFDVSPIISTSFIEEDIEEESTEDTSVSVEKVEVLDEPAVVVPDKNVVEIKEPEPLPEIVESALEENILVTEPVVSEPVVPEPEPLSVPVPEEITS